MGALVEFTTATFAHIARDNLDNVVVREKKMQVSFSHYNAIKLPEECGKPPDNLIKDYNSDEYVVLRRYNTEDLKTLNMRKINPPTNILHIVCIPGEMSPNNVRDIFIDAGLKVTGVLGIAKKFVRRYSESENPPRMVCFVDFADADEALLGMAMFTNKEGLKIIFSKDGVEKVKKGYEDKKMADSLVEGDDVPPLPPLVEKVVENKEVKELKEETKNDETEKKETEEKEAEEKEAEEKEAEEKEAGEPAEEKPMET